MTKKEELEVFLERAEELIKCQYIVAGVKLTNLLKSIANSETLLALFKNCLSDFDYALANKKYLVKSQHLSSDKGEFILPPNSKDLLAFVFTVLVDIDAERIDFTAFLNKYFYIDGSYASAYDSFVTSMIKPFKNIVKMLVERVIEGNLQDPIEAFMEEEARRAKEKKAQELNAKKQNELLKKAYGTSIQAIKQLLLKDKQKIKEKKIPEKEKTEMTLIIDMLANVIECEDKDAIEYAFVAYKYLAKSRPCTFIGRNKKISQYIKDVLNGLN